MRAMKRVVVGVLGAALMLFGVAVGVADDDNGREHDEIRGAFRHYYPRMTRRQEEMPLGGDFAAEGAREASRQ